MNNKINRQIKAMIQKSNVNLGSRSYDIYVGANLLENAAEYIAPILSRTKTVIITDENVARHQLARLENNLGEIEFTTIILPAGENTKSFEQAENLSLQLLSLKLERTDTIIAYGGGVIGDLVGFVASIYLRGIDFIQIPTTLLAQVDSSVGGKTGINTKQGKNLIGSFHQPRLVLIDVTTLETLAQRHIISGYGEIVKYGLINDASFFGWLEKNGPDLIAGSQELRTKAIIKSCNAKASIVSQDEKEHGARALLNLGHSFAHAFEAENGYNDDLYHGEAVVMGLILAFSLSLKMGVCENDDVTRIKNHFKEIGAKKLCAFNFDADQILTHMRGDKKMKDGKLTFVIASAIGKAYLSNNIDMADVRELLIQSLEKEK